jgi:uncharacterized glyoxalase superfamily protein PhnB
MKPTPAGWPRITSGLYYDDASAAIDWLCRAFGFEVRLKVMSDAGRVEHSELVLGDGVIMVGDAGRKVEQFPWRKSPPQVGGANTQNLMVYVDDVAAHLQRARAAGAKITQELDVHDYGDEYWADKSYGCEDLGGHQWWFTERVRTAGKPV